MRAIVYTSNTGSMAEYAKIVVTLDCSTCI